MKNKLKNPVGSLWLWYFILTIFYGFLTFSFDFPDNTALIGTLSGYLLGFVGLFVPFGLVSLFLLYDPRAWYSILFFVIVLGFIDYRLSKIHLGLTKRIILNIIILLILTIAVDLIRGTPFESWKIFLSGGGL